MAEQATRIKDQSDGDYIATRDAVEQDAEAHNRVIQLVDMASRQLLSPSTVRGVTPVSVADGVDLNNLPVGLTDNLIDVGDKGTLVVNPEHLVSNGGVYVTPIVFNADGDTVLSIRATKSSAMGDSLFCWGGSTDVWVQRAAQLDSETNILSLAVFNGKLYGGTGDGGCLFEWNGADAWVLRAAQLNGQVNISSLVVFNDKLYGGTGNGGCLFEWNGAGSWVQKAAQLDSETNILSLVVFNGKLYGGTGNGGRLFEWNGTDAWVQKAAQEACQPYILSLIVFNSKLYGSTGNNGGFLFEWNGTDAWVIKATPVDIEQAAIPALAIFNDKLYGGDGGELGRLFEWNGIDTWVQKAPFLAEEMQGTILSLGVFNNKLYGGTQTDIFMANGGRLFEWNGTDAWVQKATHLGGQHKIFSIVVFNGKLYGGTGDGGRLFSWGLTSTYSSPQLQWDVLGASKIGLHITKIEGTSNKVILKGGVI